MCREVAVIVEEELKLSAALGALQISMNWLAILESGVVGGGEYACGERFDDRCGWAGIVYGGVWQGAVAHLLAGVVVGAGDRGGCLEHQAGVG